MCIVNQDGCAIELARTERITREIVKPFKTHSMLRADVENI
jgi:hypothetical protein